MPSVSMSFSSNDVTAPDQYQSQGGYQQTQDGSSCQERNLRNNFAGTLPPATDYTNAMISSGPAVDDNGVVSYTAQESLFSLLYLPGTSTPTNADIERHQLFNAPLHPTMPCPFPAHDHSHHCGGHEEFQRYHCQYNVRQSDSLMPSAVMMERGNSHRSIGSTHSRRSRRSLPSTVTT